MNTNDNLPSYKELADIFKQDISEQEFMEIWKTIKSSVKAIPASISVLEGLAYFDDDFIMENRFFWGDIFELAEDMSYILQNDLFSNDEKECLFNKAFEEAFFHGLDEDAIKILRSIFDVEEKPLEIRRYGKLYYSFEPIFQKFKTLLEHENEIWVDYLKRAEELKPDDEEVAVYLHKYSVFS